jgi:hypothetical protein
MLTFILPVFLIVALVAVLPIWRHSKKWSFYPLSILDRPFLGEKIRRGSAVALWAWEAFQQRLARLYEQNAPREEIRRRIGQYVRR